MKGIKTFTALAALALTFSISLHAFAGGEKSSINTKTSTVKWTGEKVTGNHTGMISIKSGDLTIENGKIKGGNIVIDMNSITCTDLEDAEYNGKLVGHLKSDDFFGVSNHPTASFKIDKVETVGKQTKLSGKLTIKGVTKDYSFNINESMSGTKYIANGTLTVNRTDFDIKYGSGSFFDGLGDKMIYDDFKLEFAIQAN